MGTPTCEVLYCTSKCSCPPSRDFFLQGEEKSKNLKRKQNKKSAFCKTNTVCLFRGDKLRNDLVIILTAIKVISKCARVLTWLMRISGLAEVNEMWSGRLVQVCVGANNTRLDPAGINTAADLLTNIINISLVRFKHLE